MLAEGARDRLLECFVREGALMMDLSERCSAICQARDVGSAITASGDWVPYTVLEWLEGESLETRLSRGREPRSASEAYGLLDPVARALALAHERGVVHLDVKPGNVYLLTDADAEGSRCKLLDFGIAKVVDSVGGWPSVDGVGTRSFTPAYGAPEQFSTAYGPTGPWTDVFALALVFAELVAGREPLRGRTVDALASQSCDARRRPTPRTLGALVGDGLERVLSRALAIHPSERYRDVGDFWFALGHAVKRRSETRIRARPPAPVAPIVVFSSPAVPPPPVPVAPEPPETSTAPVTLATRTASVRRSRWILPALAIAAVVGLAALGGLSAALPDGHALGATGSPVSNAGFGAAGHREIE
jgi:serine/threonine protein kinase